MDRPYQLSESTRLDGVFSVLKVSYRTLDNAGLAREELSRKLLGSCPDLVEVFRIHYQLTRGRRESGGLRALGQSSKQFGLRDVDVAFDVETRRSLRSRAELELELRSSWS